MLKQTLAVTAVLLAGLSGAAYAADPVSIVYIPKNTGNPYFESLVSGFQDGCKKLGCDFSVVAPATAEATSQIPFITAQVQHGINVIAISPNSPDALDQVFDRARKRGTLVFSVNSDMPGSEAYRDVAILPVDFTKVGDAQVELLGSMIGYQGDIAILSATTDAPDQNTWIGEMKTTLATNPKYAKMKLVKIAYGNDDPQKSTTETEALLSSYPNLRGIISPTTVGIAAAAQVVETAHKVATVKVTGLGTPDQMRRFVQDGTVTAFQLWSPYNEGLLASYYAVGVKSGKIENKPGTTFEVPGLGTVTVGANSVINTQADLTTFDKSNIEQFHF